jgi:hypothetical protein
MKPLSGAFHFTPPQYAPRSNIRKPAGAPEHSRKNKRKYFSYAANVTISRAGDEPCQNNGFFDCKALADRIHDHALRRLQIFYFSNLVYYKEEAEIQLDHTVRQHGKASCGFCHAAHSAILTNVKDNFFENLIGHIKAKGMDRTAHWRTGLVNIHARTTGAALRQLEELKKLRSRLYSDDDVINELMSSTVEQPIPVNQFDSLLEGVLREKAIRIINENSQGILSPYEATQKLHNEAHIFFDKSTAQIQTKLKLLPDLILLENETALAESRMRRNLESEEHCLNFLKALMALKRIQREMEGIYGYSPRLNLKDRTALFNPLFEEIYKLYYHYREEVESNNSLKELQKWVKSLSINTYGEEPDSHLKEASAASTLQLVKRNFLKFFYTVNLIDYYVASGDIDLLMVKMRGIIKNQPKWKPASAETLFEKLNNALFICEKQREGTEMPDLELLSGKLENGELIPMTEPELMEQKLELLKSPKRHKK